MPKFYEIKAFSVIGYISLVILSIVGYFAGTLLPIGLGILPIPFIAILVMSIFYIKTSIENKKVHPLCFSVIVFIAMFFVGINHDRNQTKHITQYLMDTGTKIENYIEENNIELLTEEDIEKLSLPENVGLELIDGSFELFYRDGIYSSETKQVYFRPRP